MTAADVSVILNLHREDQAARPAIDSLCDLVSRAREAGFTVEAVAVLDDADASTVRVVDDRSGVFDQVLRVDLRDLGSARNEGAAAASGHFVAFLDGDDLWGASWLALALTAARASADGSIWHPQYVYFFNESDGEARSDLSGPDDHSEPYLMEHRGSDEPDFDPRVLLLNNIWTSNAFAPREVFTRFPYRRIDRERGFGFEDWTWNIDTLVAGIAHRVVPGTVHMVRMKETGSLGTQSQQQGLLPYLSPAARSLLAWRPAEEPAGHE